MKKIFIILCLFASFTGKSQTNANLSTMINPAKNRGYMKWIGDNSPQYRVNVYERQDTSIVLLSTQTTTNNYVKFQPLLFSLPNLSYQIISLDEVGDVISEGEITNNEAPIGWEAGEILCGKICNGRSYAWKMTAYQAALSAGGQQHISFSSTYQHYDIESGMYTPYWQAFTYSAFQSLPDTHPYIQNTTGYSGLGGALYEKREINPDLPSNHYDANNFIVHNGILVEKRLDQFQLMNGNATTSFHPPLCQPSATAMNWADFFNNNIDESTTGIVSPYTNYFTNVDEATCSPSSGYSGGGMPDTNAYNWGTILSELDDFWDCIINYNILPSIYGCFDGSLSGFGGITISSIENDSLSVRFKNAAPDSIRGAYYLTSHSPATMPKIEKGLYNFTLYLPDGNAIPTVIELHKKIEEARPLKDLATLDLIPNPIENNKVAFAIKSDVDISKFVRIHDLYGNVVYSEEIADKEVVRDVDVSFFGSPAFIVSVVFQDGSIIQKTAIK